jgi:hypothetical protein
VSIVEGTLISLVQRLAIARRDAETAEPNKADYQIREDLIAHDEYRKTHEAIERILIEDGRFRERQGELLVHAMWERFNSDLTAHWLAVRATSVPAEQACSDLDRFLSADDFPYAVYAAVSGIFTDHDVQFGPNLWLRTEHRKYLPEPLQPKGWFRSLLHMPTAALVEERHQRIRKHLGRDGKESRFERALLESDDVLLCLSLVRPPAVPFLVGLICRPAEWVPLYGYLNFPRSLESSGHQTRLGREHTQAAQVLYESFRGLSRQAKDRMRLPMSRLNAALRRRENTDTAIDLGIALESMLLGKVDTDKRYQAAIRCSFLLGENPDAKHRLHDLASELYNLRNKAVHRGALKPDDLVWLKGQELHKVLEEGSQLIARMIKRFIDNKAREPDWNSLVLGPRSETPVESVELGEV